MAALMNCKQCKICGGEPLDIFAHTAKCQRCGVLLYYPYPPSDDELLTGGHGKPWTQKSSLAWYSNTSFYNHHNFTARLRFAMDKSYNDRAIDILDYGGGGGQFALVCKSHYPQATVYITDISDEALLEQWKHNNRQIPFKTFAAEDIKFDFIFMNDVFEHLSDPLKILQLLKRKLKAGGKIFIDTPKQFWIYPVTKLVSKRLYTKLLRGTVSTSHLQIWSLPSFNLVVRESGLKIAKYAECSEFTQPPEFYMKNMAIKNPLLLMVGRMFYANAKRLANNKILCVLGA